MDLPTVALPNDLMTAEATKPATTVHVMPHVLDEQLSQFLARPILIQSYTAADTTMFPISIFNKWSVLRAKQLSGYKYFRGCLKLHVMYTGNPQASGTEILSFYPQVGNSSTMINSTQPFTLPTLFASKNYSPSPWLQLPHLQLNMEQTNTAEFCLPFPNNVQTIDIATGGDWWANARTLNPLLLNSGLTPTNPLIEIYASYEDVELYGPVQVQGELKPHLLSRGLNYVSELLSYASGYYPMMTPYAAVAKFGGALAERMGFSRPLITVEDAIFRKINSSLAYVSGEPDASEKLSLDPRISLDVSGSRIPMAKDDDTNCLAIARKWGLILVGNTSSALTLEVEPAFGEPLTLSTWVQTPLEFVSGFFQFWKGSIEYKFEFVSNSLLRQRVAIYIVPPNSIAPTSYSAGITYPVTLVDVVGRTETVVTVPFYHTKPFMELDAHNNVVSVSGTRIVILRVFATQGQSGTATNLPVNVYVRAGPDFEWAVPNSFRNAETLVIQGDLGIVEIQGDLVDSASVPVFGEKVEDLLQLTRRSTYVANITGALGVELNLPFYGFPEAATTVGVTALGTTPINYTISTSVALRRLMSAYIGCSGGIRYKLLNPTGTYYLLANRYDTVGTVSRPARPAPYNRQPSGTAVSFTENKLIEVELPMQTPEFFVHAARATGQTAAGSNPGQVLNIRTATAATMDLAVYHSAADDFVCRGWLTTPLVQLKP